MQVLIAAHWGLCFGVRDALATAHAIEQPDTVTIHGQLVHNEQVLVQLAANGFRQTPEDQQDMLPSTESVLITAHGISQRMRHRLQAAGKRLIDTTCPLVRRAHHAAEQLASAGYHVLVIGRHGHVEVRGLIEDLASYDVVPDAAAVRCYTHSRLGVICQTTTPPQVAAGIRAAIVERNPHAEVRFIDTICQPTRDRQQAVLDLLPWIDALVVVGGNNSNNTRALAALGAARGMPTFQVQAASELRADWFATCRCVGLTAGTSTPDATVEEVRAALAQIDHQRAPCRGLTQEQRP